MMHKNCLLCPRQCNIDRESSLGYCMSSTDIKVARAALHFWEEPCISGQSGSGAVFFSGCNLRCVFCQNHAISDGSAGKCISVEHLAEIFLSLQEQKAHNINLVTPSHYVPQIAQSLILAKDQGLTIPVIYNTGSYELVDTLKQLDGLIDIYLPDLKYYDDSLAMRYSHAPHYFSIAQAAISEMYRQVGKIQFEEEPFSSDPAYESDSHLLKKGMIVRHLMLPGCLDDSKKIMHYLQQTYSDHIFISIMNQFTPMPRLSDYPEINRKVSFEEYDELIDYCIDSGIENAFIQEGETSSESFIPAFDETGV